MARTFQQVVDRARIPLNDPSKVLYPDADLLSYANDAILLLRRVRPDLFLGAWTIPPGEYLLTNDIPVPDTFFPIICDYVTGRVEFRDDEEGMQQRAAAFMQMAMGAL